MSNTVRQTLFFGASVVNFTSSVGWNDETSSINITLVEDKSSATKYYWSDYDINWNLSVYTTVQSIAQPDIFNPPPIGAPVWFQFENFHFGGILQNWQKVDGIDGITYQINVVDPREIVQGSQAIIAGFTGITNNVPNLLNVYGYLESAGFGTAQVNEAGMPWYKFKDAVTTMTQTLPFGTNPFGGKLVFRGYQYSLDFSLLPIPPNSYRIAGDTISIHDAISQLCKDSSVDFYVKMLMTAGFGMVIKYFTTSKKFQPQLGRIQQFINSTPNVMVKNIGRELRSEPTSIFVNGSNVEQLFTVQYDSSIDPSGHPEDATIWPYWGLDFNGNAILGSGTDSQHSFSLDTHSLPIQTIKGLSFPKEYPCSVGELRAAMTSHEVWRAYIVAIEPDKATQYGIVAPNIPKDILEKILNGDFHFGLLNTDRDSLDSIKYERYRFEEDTLYEFVKNIALEYYGKKFMVKTPQVNAYVEPDTVKINYSYEPSDAGFLSETDWNAGNSPLGLHPLHFDKFQPSQDGRFGTFVKFTDAKLYDFGEQGEENLFVSGDNAWVKCDIDNNFVFVDRNTLTDPRVVITLPGPVFPANLGNPDDKFTMFKLLEWIINTAHNQGIDGVLTQEQKETLDNIINAQAALTFDTKLGLPNILPPYAAIPLKSNTQTYGPWYGIGAQGPTRYEQIGHLNPWTFGGYQGMNSAGGAIVSEALSNLQISEMGSLEIPGAPLTNLGEALIAGGPNVTNISVAMSDKGITTSYLLKTYTPNPYGFSKSNLDRLTRVVRSNNELRTMIAKDIRKGQPSSLSVNKDNVLNRREEFRSKEDKAKTESPHSMMIGQLITRFKNADYFGITGVSVPLVSTRDMRETMMALPTDDTVYQQMGAMSVDGMFRPFSTDTGNPYLPHFEKPTQSGVGNRSVEELNPYFNQDGSWECDINYMLWGNQYPQKGFHLQDTGIISNGINHVRGIALKAPIVMAGWGWDTNDKPVPNEAPNSPTDVFASGYRHRTDLWKVGPLDSKWDNDRKVWVAAGGGSYFGVLQDDISGVFGNNISSGRFQMFITVTGVPPVAATRTQNGEIKHVYNYYTQLLRVGTAVEVVKDLTNGLLFVGGADCVQGI